MKLFKFFKKETSKKVKNNIQKMDKKQLEKVIGGGDGTIDPLTTETVFIRSKSNIKNN